jgi:hypothetical protein
MRSTVPPKIDDRLLSVPVHSPARAPGSAQRSAVNMTPPVRPREVAPAARWSALAVN